MTITYRASTPADADAICRHRADMFLDMGKITETVRLMEAPFREWLLPRLADGRYFGITAEVDGQDAGHAGAMVLDWPPGPNHPTLDTRGYIFNVHVDRAFRRMGIARQMMRLIEAELTKRGVVYAGLQASDAARPFYHESGWRPTSDMAKHL